MGPKHRTSTPRDDGRELTFALREAREERGISQSELARRVGLPQPTISHMESDDCRRVTLTTMASCLAALNEDGSATSGELKPGDLFKWVEVAPEDQASNKKANKKAAKKKATKRKTKAKAK